MSEQEQLMKQTYWRSRTKMDDIKKDYLLQKRALMAKKNRGKLRHYSRQRLPLEGHELTIGCYEAIVLNEGLVIYFTHKGKCPGGSAFPIGKYHSEEVVILRDPWGERLSYRLGDHGIDHGFLTEAQAGRVRKICKENSMPYPEIATVSNPVPPKPFREKEVRRFIHQIT